MTWMLEHSRAPLLFFLYLLQDYHTIHVKFSNHSHNHNKNTTTTITTSHCNSVIVASPVFSSCFLLLHHFPLLKSIIPNTLIVVSLSFSGCCDTHSIRGFDFEVHLRFQPPIFPIKNLILIYKKSDICRCQ